jgi:hypothetical protein
MIYHICRRARIDDIKRARPLWECHKVMFEPSVWQHIDRLLEDLFLQDLISFGIVERFPDGIPKLFGGISFVRRNFIEEARTQAVSLPNAVMVAALAGRNPFLTPEEVARENARGNLNMMHFFGDFKEINLNDAELANFYDVNTRGHRLLVYGYDFSSIWMEVQSAYQANQLLEIGMVIDRKRLVRHDLELMLMRLTRKEALQRPHLHFCGLFFPPKPVFKLSEGEQRLLELSLLDFSDQEASDELHVSADAIKKRWRSIYEKVEFRTPELLASVSASATRRRVLLNYFRNHLEELRPYDYTP